MKQETYLRHAVYSEPAIATTIHLKKVSFDSVSMFFVINMDIQIRLYIPRLISRNIKLTNILACNNSKIYKT